MLTTIDSAGRVVIPKSVRELAHLTPGRSIEIRYEDGAIVIEPIALPVKLKRRGRLLVAEACDQVSPLSESIVEETRDRLRRRHGKA